jgi:hypothetical protein
MTWNNPIPSFPKSFSSLRGKKLRHRAEDAWRAAHALCNAILAWELWLDKSQVQYRSEKRYDVETGDAICRSGAAAIQALCELGVCSHIFHGDAGPLLAWFPPAPSDGLDPTWYVWKVEGAVDKEIHNYKFHCHTTLEPAARELLDLLVEYPETALNPPRTVGDPAGDGEKRYSGNSTPDEANQTAIKLAKQDSAFVNGGAREWAAAIRKATDKTCSTSTVEDTPLWKATMKKTGRGRTRGKAPKAVTLTDGLESVTGEGERHEVLQGLIAQQKADYEPSPVDDDAPTKRQKPKQYKQV